MAKGAAKITSLNGALTVTFTAASGATPVVYSDEATVTTVSLPATIADGATSTFYFASPGSYTLSVKDSSGVEQAGDLNGTRVITVSPGEVAVLAYDTRRVARDASGGDAGRQKTNDNATYPSAAVVIPTGVAATDAAALQAAHDNLPAAGGWIYVSAGTLALGTTGVTFSKQVTLSGAGGRLAGDGGVSPTAVTAITYSGSTGDAITITSPGCTLRDFALINTAGTTPTAGTGINASTAGSQFAMERVTTLGFWNNAQIGGMYYTVESCHFYDPVNYGLYCSEPSSTYYDHGDQGIINNVFTSLTKTYAAAAAIRWEAGGGPRIVGNKINGATQPGNSSAGSFVNGIDVCVADGVSTSVIIVSGNSVENCTNYLVGFRQKGPSNTGNVQKIVVTGNEIGTGGYGTIIDPTTTNNFKVVTIEGNVYTSLVDSIITRKVSTVSIGPNAHRIISSWAVLIDSGTLNWTMAPQTYDSAMLQLFRDTTVPDTTHVARNQARLDIGRELPAITSTSTYTGLFDLTLPTNQCCMIEVWINAAVVGVGNGVQRLRRYCTRASGAVTVSTLGTNDQAGTNFDVNFDTTTNSGRVRVSARLNSFAGGTDMNGLVGVTIFGPINEIRKI